MAKRVYLFGGTRTEGRADIKNLLGGKGANLAEMCQIRSRTRRLYNHH